MLYYIVAGGIVIYGLWAAGSLSKEREEKLKTSKCLKCDEGVGQLQQSNKGKYSYKCDNCGSDWVERR
ncbi:hypothetical protein [Gracilimonas sp.]|uniref:hypothetical protein n=1 Tax=Gracilimonas sp. TaxID=1974203 RepID=UPI0032EAA677